LTLKLTIRIVAAISGDAMAVTGKVTLQGTAEAAAVSGKFIYNH